MLLSLNPLCGQSSPTLPSRQHSPKFVRRLLAFEWTVFNVRQQCTVAAQCLVAQGKGNQVVAEREQHGRWRVGEDRHGC